MKKNFIQRMSESTLRQVRLSVVHTVRGLATSKAVSPKLVHVLLTTDDVPDKTESTH